MIPKAYVAVQMEKKLIDWKISKIDCETKNGVLKLDERLSGENFENQKFNSPWDGSKTVDVPP